MTSVKLSSLPADVQDILRPLSRDEFETLANDAHLQRTLAAQKALPTDPHEAIKAIFDAFKLTDAPTHDCLHETLVNILTILRMAFSSADTTGDGIDAGDCYALWELASQGHSLAVTAREQRFRTMEHCRHILFPTKK